MAEGDRIDGINLHLERVDLHLGRLVERMDEALSRNDLTIARNTQALEANTRAWAKHGRSMEAMQQRLADMGGEIRAQTEALLRVVDRFDGNGRQA